MESTEPAPIKVGSLPALKTSSWNDRDYAGIGTNNSVMHFDGTKSIHAGSLNDALEPGNNDYWYETWVCPTLLTGYHEIMNSRNSDGGDELEIRFGTSSGDGKITINSANITQFSDGIARNVGQWYHIIAGKNGSTGRLYVNGEQTATSPASGTIDFDGTQNFVIGSAHNGTASFFNGFMESFMYLSLIHI